MEPQSPTMLVVCGKSAAENELARCLKNNNTLKLPDDSPVTVALQSEIENQENENVGSDDVFRINLYMDLLSTSLFGKLLIFSPKLASTHDVVSSSKAEMEDGRIVPLVQYVVSLAMTEAINDVCRRNVPYAYYTFGQLAGWNVRSKDGDKVAFAFFSGMPSLDVRIKWPNDLYLDGLKVGGILCTSTYKSKKFNVSAGIGLNVNNQKPTICLNAVLQRLGCVARQVQREEIIAAFFNKFECFYDIFITQGFQALEELYYKTWLHSGQRVILQEKNEDQDQISEHVVTIKGLTTSGYLLAATEDGQTCELHPDGNRLCDLYLDWVEAPQAAIT
ncbi:hypothetical protein DH2020_007130 [Rehmannia glutinosa]|uniref:BPL/LPL catalytic domain-containing protein n=1 Tax=Rehmannia glutinosa TaxID=99300 RepID=A0ABR0TX43_REHGL